MLCETMAEITRHYKETPEGVSIMCKAVEDYGKKKMQEGILESIRKIIKGGELSYESISRTFGISVDEVKKIAATV